MAEFQKKAFVRMENRLVEACLDSRDFHETHFRVVLALARLTIGWGQRTASMTAKKLADYCGVSYSGGYHRTLHDLVANNVVLQLDEGDEPTYALQLDYTTWGKFGANDDRLKSRWDRRPKQNDSLLRHAEASGQLALVGGTSILHETADPEEGILHGESEQESSAPGRIPNSPVRIPNSPMVTGRPAKSLFDETVAARKDIERKERHTTTTTATAAREPAAVVDHDEIPESLRHLPDEAPPLDVWMDERVQRPSLGTVAAVFTGAAARVAEPARVVGAVAVDEADQNRQYAIRLSVAVNDAIGARWFKAQGGENPHPVNYGTGLALADELRKAAVPVELAATAIAAVCQASKKDKPMTSIGYFRDPIFEAARLAEQDAFKKSDLGVRRGGPPTVLAASIDPEKTRRAQERAEQDEREYQHARTAAAIAWWKDPANAAAFAGITTAVAAHFAGQPDTGWAKTAREGKLVDECAKAAGFPDRDTWFRTRHDARSRSSASTSTKATR